MDSQASVDLPLFSCCKSSAADRKTFLGSVCMQVLFLLSEFHF